MAIAMLLTNAAAALLAMSVLARPDARSRDRASAHSTAFGSMKSRPEKFASPLC
jgi:hypothetical protein